jgi:hypothetical protein
VLVMLQPDELTHFMSDMSPEGIMLCIPSSNQMHELDMLNQISKWNK